MNKRTLRLLAVAFIIIIVAIGAVVLIGNTPDEDTAVEVAQGTDTPEETAIPTEPASTAIPTQELRNVVVAVQNISRGAIIPPDAIEIRPWPFEALPFSAIYDPDDVVGRIARVDLYSENPILSSMVVDTLDQLGATGSDAAAILPAGTVAITIPWDRLTSVGYAPQMGDRVDLIVSLLFIDLDEEFQSALPNMVNLLGTTLSSENEITSLLLNVGDDINGRFDTRRIPVPILELEGGRVRVATSLLDYPVVIRPAEQPRPRLLTHRTILDAQVIWTGEFPEDGSLFQEVPSPTPVGPTEVPQGQEADFPTPIPPRPDIVTIAVTPQEATIIAWLLEARVPITFTLRSAADRSRLATDPVTLDYIISQYDITVPRRNDYTIEPAIRSIRQMVIGERITLGSGQ
jgi:Flp pilus assembly protein CpaB